MFTPKLSQNNWNEEKIELFLDRLPIFGGPGITYQEIEQQGSPVEYLIYSDETGKTVGALAYYAKGFGFLKRPGEITIAVRAANQGQGIGSALLNEAIERWNIQAKKQRYTENAKVLYEKWKANRDV